eukprot:365590-Chlamydomonas_euryale.AAC.10
MSWLKLLIGHVYHATGVSNRGVGAGSPSSDMWPALVQDVVAETIFVTLARPSRRLPKPASPLLIPNILSDNALECATSPPATVSLALHVPQVTSYAAGVSAAPGPNIYTDVAFECTPGVQTAATRRVYVASASGSLLEIDYSTCVLCVGREMCGGTEGAFPWA